MKKNAFRESEETDIEYEKICRKGTADFSFVQ